MNTEGESTNHETLEKTDEINDVAVDLNSMTVESLKQLAKERGMEGYSSMKKSELIKMLG